MYANTGTHIDVSAYFRAYIQTRRIDIHIHARARRTLCAKIRSDEAYTYFASFELLFAGVYRRNVQQGFQWQWRTRDEGREL